MESESSSSSSMEGAAEWPATGFENRGGSKGQGFDSFTLLQNSRSGCGDGGPRRPVTPDSQKRALEVRILPVTPDRAGVIATGRHTRLKPELVVVRVHPPVPSARVAQWVDAVGLNPTCWRFDTSRGHQVSSASVAQ